MLGRYVEREGGERGGRFEGVSRVKKVVRGVGVKLHVLFTG